MDKKKDLTVGLLICAVAFFVTYRAGYKSEGECKNSNIFTVKAININIRKRPGKFPENQPIWVVPQGTKVCFLGNTELYRHANGTEVPWMKIRVIDDVGLSGWINRCWVDGVLIKDGFDERC